MPDLIQSWEDLTLPLDFKKGANLNDAESYVVDPIPASDVYLKSAKQALRVKLMICANKIAALYPDREAFFDAIALLGASDSDPLHDDLGYALALEWWIAYFEGNKLSSNDRMADQQELFEAKAKQAAKALCNVIGIELGKTTRAAGVARTSGTISRINSRKATLGITTARRKF